MACPLNLHDDVAQRPRLTSDPTARGGIQLNSGPSSCACHIVRVVFFSQRAMAFGKSYIQRLEPLALGLRLRN
ncbi:hypothetical protein E4U36_004429 [Claviceps purpurea]|nr:hypothetical protein E4U36_004429 [Claviceps purpurea]